MRAYYKVVVAFFMFFFLSFHSLFHTCDVYTSIVWELFILNLSYIIIKEKRICISIAWKLLGVK